jgi:hypothetical protein
MKRRLVLGIAALVSVGALVSCGDDDDDDASEVSEANTEFCDDLAAYGTAVADFAGLDSATATKDDYESAADEVRSTREDMVDSAEDLAEAEWENLLTQVDTLRDQLRDAPDDQAVQAIVDEAKPQAATVQASVATLNTAICSVGGPTTTGGT